MRREIPSIAAMAILLISSQLVAIALSPLFHEANFEAFPIRQDVTNTVVYVVMILVFTAIILGLVRYRRQNLAKYVILASIFVTLAFVLLLPVLIAVDYATGGTLDVNLLGIVSTLLSFGLAAGLVFLLLKFPEWYVVDTIGFITAAGVTAILGISFGILPAVLLLIALAIYDAWAVYRTKHMITLADELTSQRLPILLVIPKRAGYSFRDQKSLKAQVASGEAREAIVMGWGDLIIPGIMAVSAFTFPPLKPGATPADPWVADIRIILGVPSNLLIALFVVFGCLVGFLALMRFVLRGNPQAGLPLLNGGALVAFVIMNLLVYGTVHIV